MKLLKKFSILLLSIFLISNYFIINGYSIKNNNIEIKNFSLKNTDGKYISLTDYKEAKGFIIVFTCNHCPFAKLYPPRFNELNSKYKPLGIPLIAISSTDTSMYEEDNYAKMVQKALIEKFNFPYLFDGEQLVAKNFKAQKTPHAFVIWKENKKWVIKYSGAIDDNGAESKKVQNHFVGNAVEALLNGRPVEVNETKSIGCQIYFRK